MLDLYHVGIGMAPGATTYGTKTFELGNSGMDVLVVGGVNEDLAMGEELEFLGYLLLAAEEIFVVSLTDVGKDAYGGVDDAAEVLHLAGF